MALVNPQTGNYVKITGFQFDFPMGNHHINYIIFKDLEQRQRYESGLNEFEQSQTKQYNGFGAINDALESEPIQATTVKDVTYNAMYKALKADLFAGWEDS